MLIVGEKDTSFIGKSPYGTCRVERMRSLKKNLEDHGGESGTNHYSWICA